MAVAFGRGCGFASGRPLGATGPGMESYNGRRSPFLLVLGHEAHPKLLCMGLFSKKFEWAPAYGSVAEGAGTGPTERCLSACHFESARPRCRAAKKPRAATDSQHVVAAHQPTEPQQD